MSGLMIEKWRLTSEDLTFLVLYIYTAFFVHVATPPTEATMVKRFERSRCIRDKKMAHPCLILSGYRVELVKCVRKVKEKRIYEKCANISRTTMRPLCRIWNSSWRSSSVRRRWTRGNARLSAASRNSPGRSTPGNPVYIFCPPRAITMSVCLLCPLWR